MLHKHNFNPQARGYHAAYKPGETNHCPGCGHTHWLVGRLSAECAFCSTALPFSGEQIAGAPAVIFTRGSGGPKPDFRSDFR